jgi:hypothetical protein
VLQQFSAAEDQKLIRAFSSRSPAARNWICAGSPERPPKKSSRWKRRRNWMITPIASPAAWANFGRKSAARILFPGRAAGRETIHRRRHPVRQGLAAREHPARPAGGFEKWPLLSADPTAGRGEIVPGNPALARERAEKFLPLFHDYLDKAESHLAAGWRYTNTLPFGQFRVRLGVRVAGFARARGRLKNCAQRAWLNCSNT